MHKLLNFLFFFNRYPFRHKIAFLKLYLNESNYSLKRYQVSTEFIKINHKLHKFKDKLTSFNFKISNNEVLLSGRFSNTLIKTYARSNSSDLLVYDQVFIDEEYAQETKLLHEMNIMPSVIIDCGANIGCASLYLYAYYPNANYICREPDLENTQQLEKNFSLNHIKNLKIYQKGLWSKKTTLFLNTDFRDGLNWSYNIGERVTEHKIGTISLRDIINDNKLISIDLLKIDIEGAEKEVFTNDGYNCDWLNITKVIVIEIHDEYQCRENILRILIKHDFELLDSGELTIGFNRTLFKS